MSFRYRHAPFIFIALLLALTFGLLALVQVQPRSVMPLPDSSVITVQYQAAVRTIVRQYQSTSQTVPLENTLTTGQRADWKAAAAGWRDQLLGLSVPGPYRDFHLQLVLQFDLLVRATDGQGDLAAVGQQLQATIDRTAWLSPAAAAE